VSKEEESPYRESHQYEDEENPEDACGCESLAPRAHGDGTFRSFALNAFFSGNTRKSNRKGRQEKPQRTQRLLKCDAFSVPLTTC